MARSSVNAVNAVNAVDVLTPRRRGQSPLLLAAVALALSGCSTTTTTIPAEPPVQRAGAGTAAAGTAAAGGSTPSSRPSPRAAKSTLIMDAAYHFSVRLPAGYKQLTKPEIKAILKAGGTADPQLKPIIDQYVSVGRVARIFAYKPGSRGANINVLALPAKAGSNDLETLFVGVKPVVEKLGARIIAHSIEKLAGTKAMLVEYRMSTSSLTMRGTQAYLIHAGNVIVVTITQPDVKAGAADANAILRSLSLF